MKQVKKQSGASRIVEVLLGQALLNCKIGSVKSLIEKVNDITGGKLEVKKVDGPDKLDTELAPWVISLEIGDTKVIVKFILTSNYFVSKIEVSE